MSACHVEERLKKKSGRNTAFGIFGHLSVRGGLMQAQEFV